MPLLKLALRFGLQFSSAPPQACTRYLGLRANRFDPRTRCSRYVHNTTTNSSPAQERSARWPRAAFLAAGTIGGVYVWDKTLNASSIARNARTLWTCLVIAIDYKMNFTEAKSDQIPQLHERVAVRLYDLLTSNGGLYIKLGQAIGANAPLLPKPIQAKFAQLFDAAPQIPLSQVYSVFAREFNNSSPHEIFDYFEETAAASASIAQVHKARLKGLDEEGRERWVAVKVQKPDVAIQMEWDLASYKAVMWMFENWFFDLPVFFTVDFISDHLRQELDFIKESANARRTASFIAAEPRLRDKVHIPKVYAELSTERVMTAEWIDGVRLSDRSRIYELVGEKDPYAGGQMPTPLEGAFGIEDEPEEGPGSLGNSARNSSFSMPTTPLKGGTKAIMDTMVSLFSAQMFSFGFIHCDPHPGNIIIRPHPSTPRYLPSNSDSPSGSDTLIPNPAYNPSHPLHNKPQLVLLDHGLYVTLDPKLRQQYAELWRALMLLDFDKVEEVTKGWGFGNAQLFASATMMRPVRLTGRKKAQKDKEKQTRQDEDGAPGKPMSQYEVSVKMKRMLKTFLEDTDRMPKELMFLGRNMRIVQGNNQSLGSPVNRIKITGYWAAKSLTELQVHGVSGSSSNLRPSTVGHRVYAYASHVQFLGTMFLLDAAFYWTRFKQRVSSSLTPLAALLAGSWVGRLVGSSWLGRILGGTLKDWGRAGFEDEMERRMRGFAKQSLGVNVDAGVFKG